MLKRLLIFCRNIPTLRGFLFLERSSPIFRKNICRMGPVPFSRLVFVADVKLGSVLSMRLNCGAISQMSVMQNHSSFIQRRQHIRSFPMTKCNEAAFRLKRFVFPSALKIPMISSGISRTGCKQLAKPPGRTYDSYDSCTTPSITRSKQNGCNGWCLGKYATTELYGVFVYPHAWEICGGSN